MSEHPKIITSGDKFHQLALPPPPYPQQIQYFQNGSDTEIHPCKLDYNPLVQPVFVFPNQMHAKKERHELRTPALVFAVLASLCGAWLCWIPAFILAVLPECNKSLGTRLLYTVSIILSTIAIVTLALTICIVHYIYKNEIDYQVNELTHSLPKYYFQQ